MEVATARTIAHNFTHSPDRDDLLAEQRLDALLRRNAEVSRDRALYPNPLVRSRVALMTWPIDSQQVFAYFGLMIGALPPLALVLKSVGKAFASGGESLLFITLLAAAGVTTGIAGYKFGRFIPAALDRAAQYRQPNRLALLYLIGLAWGGLAGATGGLFLFVFGAIFTGIAGGLIGAVTFPLLAILHSMLKTGDFMELKHFLPIAFGITLTLCALILGL